MTETERLRDEPAQPEEAGGGAACDLHRVCDACGALEDGPPPPVCSRCGTPSDR